MDFSTRRDQRPTRPCEGAFGHSSRLDPLETSFLDEKVPSRDKRGRYARATSQENALRCAEAVGAASSINLRPDLSSEATFVTEPLSKIEQPEIQYEDAKEQSGRYAGLSQVLAPKANVAHCQRR